MFFCSSRRRHTRYWRDWSSDVCSSDLGYLDGDELHAAGHRRPCSPAAGARGNRLVRELLLGLLHLLLHLLNLLHHFIYVSTIPQRILPGSRSMDLMSISHMSRRATTFGPRTLRAQMSLYTEYLPRSR